MKRFNTLILALATFVLVGCNFTDNVSTVASIGETSVNSETTINSSESNSIVSSASITNSSSTSSSSVASNSSAVSYVPTSLPSIAYDSNWNVDFSLYGKAFKEHLGGLSYAKITTTISYSACLSVGAEATSKGDGTFVPFYHKDTTATQSECNREHTWPNSRGTGKTGPGCNPFIIRPTISSENSSRGNYFYGLGGTANKEWDPASCEFEGARGEAARAIFYCATTYYSMGFELSNNPSDATSLKTMGTLKYLIEWNKTYPVTAAEVQFNNYCASKGYGRNPFVDHPEYADYIWDKNGYITSGSSSGNSTSTSTSIDEGTKYNLVDALEDLDGASLSIVSAYNTSGPFYGLTSSAKSSSYPWYLNGVLTTLNSDKSIMSCSDDNLATYTFTKSGDKYTIKTGDKYLCNYVDGTHYSIALTEEIGTYSNTWSISKDDTGFILFGDAGVYLEYYNGSFCGYKNQPPVPIYLYQLA